MYFFSWLIIFLMMMVYLKLFHKKLMVLLSLEGGFLGAIILAQLFLCSNSISYFILILFSIFMVVDSVFGITLLISSSRSSFSQGKIFS